LLSTTVRSSPPFVPAAMRAPRRLAATARSLEPGASSHDRRRILGAVRSLFFLLARPLAQLCRRAEVPVFTLKNTAPRARARAFRG
jgi:hypothetical protein